MSTTWVPFNVNHRVRVQLTETGRRELLAQHNKLNEFKTDMNVEVEL